MGLGSALNSITKNEVWSACFRLALGTWSLIRRILKHSRRTKKKSMDMYIYTNAQTFLPDKQFRRSQALYETNRHCMNDTVQKNLTCF